MLLAGFIILSPSGIALILSNFLCQMIDWIYRFLVSVVDFISDIGVKFLGLFGWKPDKDPPDKDDGPDPPASPAGGSEEDGNSTGVSREDWEPFEK